VVASSAERQQVARAGFEAFNAGDHARVLAVLAEDVEIFSSPELANPGRFHGHDGYMRWIAAWTEAWESLDMEVTEVVPVGGRHVLANVHQIGHGRAGIEVSMEVAFLFEVTDEGLVSYVALLGEGEDAVEMARKREAAG
jgi:ketosteroid isomerase-like protein